MFKIKILIVLVVLVGAGLFLRQHHQITLKQTAAKAVATAKVDAAKAAAVELASHCAGNTLSQKIIVSISSQHMWACADTIQKYDNAIITGKQLNDDLTPLGTYRVYTKETNTRLKGCDSAGCWDDPVSYWMPFVIVSGGTIGFHDASWRTAADFGSIGTSSPNGSHGCVEMPLAAAKWLYDWAPIGTTVVVQS